MGQVVSKTQCPSCSKNGRDRRGDNLCVYDDGSTYCFSCSYSDRGDKKVSKVDKTEDISKYSAYPVRALTHKAISKSTCEKYGVRTTVHAETGQIEAVLYPYYDGDKVLKGYKVRKLPKQFSYRGDSNDIALFGQQLFKAGGKMLVVTEGEDDALAMTELLGRKGKSYSVVSIPTGADAKGTLDKKIKACYSYLSSFENVVIALDNDDAGQATAKAMGDWLASSCKVRMLKFPDGIKDAGDLLEVDNGHDVLWKCLSDASEHTPRGIVKGGSISLDDLLKAPSKGYDTPYPMLDDKLKGMRKGELVLFTAGSGIGKSTVTREIGYHMIKHHGLKVANFFLEEQVSKTMLGYVAIDNNIPLSNLCVYPDRYLHMRPQFDKSYEELVNIDRNFFYDEDRLTIESLMSSLRYYAYACEVDFIILDHISFIIGGMDVKDERKAIDLLMTELASFCTETNVGLLAVVHLKRKNTNGGKDKALNEGGQVSLTDLRGSGGLEQLSWSVVALERNQQDTEEANFSTMRVLKNRTFGFTGEAGRLYYNAETGRLLPAPEPEAYYEEAEEDKPLNTFV